MNKTLKYVLGILIFAVFMGGAYFAYDKLTESYKPGDTVENNLPEKSPSEEETTEDSEYTEIEDHEIIKAPDFKVLDYQGNEVTLAEHFGKPIVVNFWATWCGPCKYELPDFDSLAKEYGDEVVFMMVNMTDGSQETVDKVKKFVEDEGYTFPVYFDTESEAAYTYGIYSIPRSLFIKPNGEINYAYIGVMDEESLRNNINSIIE